MKMRLQNQLVLLGTILGLAACEASPERSDPMADGAQAGEEKIAPVTQDATADAAVIQPAAANALDNDQRSGGPQRDSTIFQAAGLHFVQARNQWESGSCGDPPLGVYEPGAISKVEDINGDGRPEALVTEGGICYGNIGMRFWLLSQQPGGQWKVMTESIAIPEFLDTKGVDGFPDIQGGGPGFCFPVARWNGREYALNRHQYEGKPCTPHG